MKSTETVLFVVVLVSNMRRAGVLAVVALVITAGCFTPVSPGESGDSKDTSENTAPGDPNASNPWEKETLTVSVVHDAGPWRNISGLVADTLRYWENHDGEYGSYEVSYALEPNASDPDVVVRYVEDVSVCGPVSRAEVGGFAPRISTANPPDPPEYICVRAGYNEAATRHILNHEFGHLLGLGHDDQPRNVMEPRHDYRRIPRPSAAVLNATLQPPLTVAVDRSTIYARRKQVANQQLASVLAYYERGADGSMNPVQVTEVADRAAADIVIDFPRQSPCAVETGSCGSLVHRPDGSPQLEVAITTTHEDTFGWQMGFWLAIAAGVDRHGDLPPPFRNATFTDRRSAWWDDE